MQHYTRRRFLRNTGAAAAMIGVSLSQFLSACKDADESRLAAHPFKTLSSDEAREIDAIAACIVPTTDTPGAREAGSIYFIDAVLSDSRPDLIEPLRAGLADVQTRAKSTPTPAAKFSELDEESQIAVLTGIDDTDFFYQIRLLTLAGMFADPSYGGNRDRIGWDLIGFDGHFGTQPPFGWYDDASHATQ